MHAGDLVRVNWRSKLERRIQEMKGKGRSKKAVKTKRGASAERDVCSSSKESEEEPGRLDTTKATESTSHGGTLDDKLEATALKKNLSVINVKSILHHLVKDQRVFKLVQRLAASDEGGEAANQHTSDDWDELTAYEPRLTRSRVRQAVMSAVASGSLSTDKITMLKSSSKPATSSQTATDHSSSSIANDTESSDEEYNPGLSSGDEEEEEEEVQGEEEMEMEEVETNKDENEEDNEEVGGVSNEHSTAEVLSSMETSAPLPLTSNQTTPTSTQTTPTTVLTPPSPSTTSAQQQQEMQDHEVQETALLLASLAGNQNTFSPLKYLTQHSTSTVPSRGDVISLAGGVSDSAISTGSSSGDVINCAGVVSSNTGSSSRDVISCAGGVSSNMASTSSFSGDVINCAGGVSINTHQVSSGVKQPLPLDASNVAVSGSSTVEGIPPGICRIDPLPPNSCAINIVSREEEIAQRTRSKQPLHDVSITSLEAGLGPVEGEDPPTPRELDPDELWWHQWLNTLTTDPLNDSLTLQAVEEEEEEDGEYNFLADCLRLEEREEFRNDRAVRIPRKEVDDLISELLNPSVECSGGLSADELDLTGAYLLETLGVQFPVVTHATSTESSITTSAPQLPQTDDPTPPPASSEYKLSKEQTQQLWTQIQQHFQLIMQTFVLARFEPSLVFVSQVAAQALEELSRWCSTSKDAGEGGSALWYIPDLQDGLELVKKLDPYDDSAVKLKPSAGTPPKVPEGAQRVFMDTMLFWSYPHFLPASGFTPLTTSSTSVSKYFTPEEERLLVLGMEHYGPTAWEQIHRNVLPTKTLKQLKLRVKNRCSKRSGSNVIKEYKKTKKIPQIQDDLQPELPQWITLMDKKLVHKEKEDVNKKQKQIDEVRKILRSASRAAANMTTELSKRDTPTVSSSEILTDRAQLAVDSTSVPPSGSKHHCNNDAGVESVAKRPRVSTSKHSKASRETASNRSEIAGANSECSEHRASLEHLLVAAGVEVSDPMAQFSYKFLREVKNVVSDSGPNVYHQFIELLRQHCQQEWRPSQLYERVQQLFERWPHLVSLFTEFLSPQDCLEADVLEEKQDVENVKSFLSKLQAQYGNAPLELKQITDRLKQLDTPSVTRQQVYDSLLPVVRVHQGLTDDLQRFLFHLAPAPLAGESYEEITLQDNQPPDGFEQVTLLGSRAN